MSKNYNELFDTAIKTFKAQECHIPNGTYTALISYMGWKEEEEWDKHLLWEFTLIDEGSLNGKTVMEEYPLQDYEDVHNLYMDLNACGCLLSSFAELESVVSQRKLLGKRVKIQLEDEYFNILEVLQDAIE